MDSTTEKLFRACDALAAIVSHQLQGVPDDEETLEDALALANDALIAAREPRPQAAQLVLSDALNEGADHS